MNQAYNDVMSGVRDHNIRFADLCGLLINLGFVYSAGKGSHHKFSKPGVNEIMVLQPKGTFAKDYQVRQVRILIKKYEMEAKK